MPSFSASALNARCVIWTADRVVPVRCSQAAFTARAREAQGPVRLAAKRSCFFFIVATLASLSCGVKHYLCKTFCLTSSPECSTLCLLHSTGGTTDDQPRPYRLTLGIILERASPVGIALWDELSDELAELGRQMPRIPLGIDLAIDETCAVLYEGKGQIERDQTEAGQVWNLNKSKRIIRAITRMWWSFEPFESLCEWLPVQNEGRYRKRQRTDPPESRQVMAEWTQKEQAQAQEQVIAETRKIGGTYYTTAREFACQRNLRLDASKSCTTQAVRYGLKTSSTASNRSGSRTGLCSPKQMRENAPWRTKMDAPQENTLERRRNDPDPAIHAACIHGLKIVLIAWSVLSVPAAFVCGASAVSVANAAETKRNEANNDCPNPMRHRSPLHPR